MKSYKNTLEQEPLFKLNVCDLIRLFCLSIPYDSYGMSDVLYRKCAPILSTAKSKNSHFAIDKLIKRVEKDKWAFQLIFLTVVSWVSA